jgi:hypothetical protein
MLIFQIIYLSKLKTKMFLSKLNFYIFISFSKLKNIIFILFFIIIFFLYLWILSNKWLEIIILCKPRIIFFLFLFFCTIIILTWTWVIWIIIFRFWCPFNKFCWIWNIIYWINWCKTIIFSKKWFIIILFCNNFICWFCQNCFNILLNSIIFYIIWIWIENRSRFIRLRNVLFLLLIFIIWWIIIIINLFFFIFFINL